LCPPPCCYRNFSKMSSSGSKLVHVSGCHQRIGRYRNEGLIWGFIRIRINKLFGLQLFSPPYGLSSLRATIANENCIALTRCQRM
jgi:hypothetical protein